jgi:hypothetical protein
MSRLIALVLALGAPAGALAASVYLNGVNIDGVTNQVFDNCRVEIDAYGNVKIVAKGYAVKGSETAAAAPSPAAPAGPVVGGPPTKRYFLVTEKAAPGMTQYDVDLFVNAKWVRKFLDDEQHVVMEITKHLLAGPNKLQLLAKKNVAAGRRSASPQHYFRIIMGEGEESGRNVMITKKALDYKRTAFETQDFTNDFVLNAQ